MSEWPVQLVGLVLLVLPLIAIQWNLAGVDRPRSTLSSKLLAPPHGGSRWRVEIYASSVDVEAALVDLADVPFPVRRVRSTKAERAEREPEMAWALPRVELDAAVIDPLADEALAGLLGADHRLRFVSGNEAVLDTPAGRVRVRALRSA